MRTPAERRSDAYHEAAHAVVAAAVGLDVTGCWLDDEGGETALEGKPSSTTDALAVAVAGCLAQDGSPPVGECERVAHALSKEVEPYRALLEEDGFTRNQVEERMGNPNDALDLASLLRGMNEMQVGEQLCRAVARAQEVLTAQWACVERIAGSLRGGDD